MNIIYGKPPIWDRVSAALRVNDDTIFTYGSDVYVPSGRPLDSELIAHEAVHIKQQIDPVGWWDAYLKSEKFRISQELPAYKAQYEEFCRNHKDRNERARYLVQLAGFMAGPLYGRMIDFHAARAFIMGR